MGIEKTILQDSICINMMQITQQQQAIPQPPASIIIQTKKMLQPTTQPIELSPRTSSQGDSQIDVQSIIENSKKQLLNLTPQQPHPNPQQKQPEVPPVPPEQEYTEQELDQIQLEMLVEECEELIGKISPNIHNFYMQEENSVISDVDQSFTMKKEKNRLEKQYIELCLEIQRQQKELQNFRFKVQVAQKQAEYYSRQIKEKTAILENLEQHTKKARQSFKKS